jgi:hypothetical protein
MEKDQKKLIATAILWDDIWFQELPNRTQERQPFSYNMRYESMVDEHSIMLFSSKYKIGGKMNNTHTP